MRRLLLPILVIAAALVAGTPGTPAPLPKGGGGGVWHDSFDGKFTLDWKVVRPDKDHVSFKKVPGCLVITTQRGTIHGKEKDDAFSEGTQARNIHLIDVPLGKDRDWQATTCVRDFVPDTIYQQAGLIVYDGDDDYLKWGYETDGQRPAGQQFVLVAETEGVPAHDRPAGSESGLKKFWLRVTKRGDRYEYAWSKDGDRWVAGGERQWGTGAPKRVGILAKNGGNKDAPEIDAAFEFFELRAVPPVGKK
jgi:regulation of enolase protein 1 (concanavalin A-like superfamily)